MTVDYLSLSALSLKDLFCSHDDFVVSQSSLAAPLPSRIKLSQTSPEHSFLSIRHVDCAWRVGNPSPDSHVAPHISADRGVPELPLWVTVSTSPTGATPHFQCPSITRQRLLCCVLHMSSWFNPVSKRGKSLSSHPRKDMHRPALLGVVAQAFHQRVICLLLPSLFSPAGITFFLKFS
jgi:hypothetical protein